MNPQDYEGLLMEQAQSSVFPLLAIRRRLQRPYHHIRDLFRSRARLSLRGPFRGVARLSPAEDEHGFRTSSVLVSGT